MFGKENGLNHRALCPLLACGLILALLPTARAALINYGDRTGSTVDYQQITESSATDPVPLFNAPLGPTPTTVFGDTLLFSPNLFDALSQFGSPPLDLTDGHLTFAIAAHTGFGIRNFSLSETVFTTVLGNGTNNTYTDVSASGVMNIVEVDGVGINPVKVLIDLVFSPNANGTWRLVANGQVSDQALNGSQFIDVAARLNAANVPFVRGATKILVNLDNSLFAQSEPNTIAKISKKDFGGVAITVNIPEPTSVLLGVVALGLFSCLTRRR